MNWAKRIFLFLAVNFLVVFTISIILNLFNVQPYLNAHGLDYKELLTFCLIWGMGGAFISLALSRVMAKWMLNVRLVSSSTTDPSLQQLLSTVEVLAKGAGLKAVPQVGVYESPEVNAFATGPTQKRSLVAVSSGLLKRLNQEELEGVLGHEIAHIANGDMVTMTLLQGVVNAFVMFLARVLAFFFSGINKQERSSSGSYMAYSLLVFLFQFVFMILGSLVIAWYSRFREFRADRGGARLAGKQKMIGALQALQHVVQTHDPAVQQPALQAMKISAGKASGLIQLFSTHPALEERIKKLQGS